MLGGQPGREPSQAGALAAVPEQAVRARSSATIVPVVLPWCGSCASGTSPWPSSAQVGPTPLHGAAEPVEANSKPTYHALRPGLSSVLPQGGRLIATAPGEPLPRSNI